jgi:eukaryotic-like serine/threonine-protein kinase
MHAWVLEKGKPLGRILVERGDLDEQDFALLEPLVAKHVERHGGDPERSLQSLTSVSWIRRDLQAVADPELNVSVTRLGTAPDGTVDPEETASVSVGEPSFAGQRFRILRPHASGGLGEVYVARDGELNREVALKQIKDRYADHPESRSRFLLEAEVTGGLEHPGIVPVYGLGHYPDGRPFYAMRFIRGDSLKEAIERFHQADAQPGRDHSERTLALRQLLRRYVDVCNAVAYAHSRGVLHRDLKPGNVMLGPYGETLVVDWGLAKPIGRPEGAAPIMEGTLRPSSGSGLAPTQMGSAVGTPPFMSPEQAAGRLNELGPASDVYSLGAMLYSLLTGRAPFTDADLGDVLRKVQAGEFPPPRQVDRTVPPALAATCLKAMAKDPDSRYPSPKALADEIEHWLADEPVAAWREPFSIRARRWARRHRTAVTGAAAAVAVGVIGLSAVAVVQSRATSALEAKNLQLTQANAATTEAKNEAETALAETTKAKEETENGNSFSGSPYCIGVYVETYGLFIKAITIE